MDESSDIDESGDIQTAADLQNEIIEFMKKMKLELGIDISDIEKMAQNVRIEDNQENEEEGEILEENEELEEIVENEDEVQILEEFNGDIEIMEEDSDCEITAVITNEKRSTKKHSRNSVKFSFKLPEKTLYLPLPPSFNALSDNHPISSTHKHKSRHSTKDKHKSRRREKSSACDLREKLCRRSVVVLANAKDTQTQNTVESGNTVVSQCDSVNSESDSILAIPSLSPDIQETIIIPTVYNHVSHMQFAHPRGRCASPEHPQRTPWNSKRLLQLAPEDPQPIFTNKLIGEGDVVYLENGYGLIRSCSNYLILFELGEALWPYGGPQYYIVKKGDWVSFTAILWPKTRLPNLGNPIYEALTVRVLDTEIERPIKWRCMKDTGLEIYLPRTLQGTARVWYKGTECSLMRDLNTGQHIFLYNFIQPNFKENKNVDFVAIRRERYIHKHGIWTFFDAVRVIPSKLKPKSVCPEIFGQG